MTHSERGKLGFAALCRKHFGGDVAACKKYVADLGRAAYFKDVRPPTATRILFKYYDIFPQLVMVRVEDGETIPYYPNIGGIVWR